MAQLELALSALLAEIRPRPAPVPRRATAPVPLPQLALPLEQTAATIRGQVRIEQVIRGELGPKVIVQLTQNRSTMISFSRRRGVLYLRLHAIFCDAPELVLKAVAGFVDGRRLKLIEGQLIDDYIEAHRHRVKKVEEQELVVQPVGETHDLGAIMGALNERYFERKIAARITWSRAAKNQRRHSIRMGSYCDEQGLIRIHPALDQPFVPEYFVGSVVFHEMLHELHGVEEKDGRRCVHTPAFQQDERRFHDFDRAQKWEQKHLSKLLRY